MQQLGIAVPDLDNTILERARQAQLLNNGDDGIHIVSETPHIFTDEQRCIFNEIISALRGPAMQYSTFEDVQALEKKQLNAICAQAGLDGLRTAPSAATSLAALNQDFGLTFHHTWDVPGPNPGDGNVLQSGLPSGKQKPHMDSVRVCTIDEAPSLHIAAFEAAARELGAADDELLIMHLP